LCESDGIGAWRVFSCKTFKILLSVARADIADYLGWYNTHRPHSSLDRLTPHEKYCAALPQLKLAA
jgi:transposase InsO family protein